MAFYGPAAVIWDIGLWEGRTGGNGDLGSFLVLGMWEGSCSEASLSVLEILGMPSGEGFPCRKVKNGSPLRTCSCLPKVARRVLATLRHTCLNLSSPHWLASCRCLWSSEPVGPADDWGCESAAGTRPALSVWSWVGAGTIPKFGDFLPKWQGVLVNYNLLNSGLVSLRWEREERSQVQLGFHPSVFR